MTSDCRRSPLGNPATDTMRDAIDGGDVGVEPATISALMNSSGIRSREGRLDASIAATTITSEREAVIDFSHPFYHTGL